MRELNFTVIPAQAAGSVNSAAENSSNIFQVSAQLVATGSAAGTLKLQASNDNPLGNTVPVNWSDIPSATVAVSGAGAYLIPKTEICYQYIRAVYTNSGTGTIAVIIKALGA